MCGFSEFIHEIAVWIICTEVTSCTFLPFTIHLSSLSELYQYVLRGQIISFMYYDCFSILSPSLLTRIKGVACSYKNKLGAEIALLFLRETLSLCRNCYCKLYCYKSCVSLHHIPVSMYRVTMCSFSIQWRESIGKQAIKDMFLRSGKSMGH